MCETNVGNSPPRSEDVAHGIFQLVVMRNVSCKPRCNTDEDRRSTARWTQVDQESATNDLM
jgi:hypothetical protein